MLTSEEAWMQLHARSDTSPQRPRQRQCCCSAAWWGSLPLLDRPALRR